MTTTKTAKVVKLPTKEPVKKPKPINNEQLVKDFHADGGRIVHRRSNKTARGVTFAYRVKGKRVEVATAVQHPHDCFTKKIGTQLAIKHFREGKTITLPMVYKDGVANAIRAIGIYL